ncbi:MAG: S41 family peptidase [bacterium]|nr:MAG: S41 family peptidase [bacterium]
MATKKNKNWLLWAALTLISLLFFINLSRHFLFSADNSFEQIKRFMNVFNIVRSYYVEEVDAPKLVSGAIQGMLEQLDPHCVYIEPEKLKEINEQFHGSYEGIGIEFIIQNKILTIVAPIAGSPSEALGLRPGDQIIQIEGKSAYGITEQEVQKKLKGPKGTKVTVTIRRPGFDEPFDITITRDKIPIYSVMAKFLIKDKIGYIYVGRFAQTTAEEFEKALRELEIQGMDQLLLDLRGNTGGYLDQAFKMADKFIEGNKVIVYTRGRVAEANDEFRSTNAATHRKYPLVILINKGSASASEIVAGAVQDWDRGLIVGETSFGKGLVQTQLNLKDGSALRITTARYYTPSGRLIQRSYEDGLYEYYTAGYEEAKNEIKNNIKGKPVFLTNAGRKVYGGGGIAPDVEITSKRPTKLTNELIFKRLFLEFGSKYGANHQELKQDFSYYKNNFQVDEKLLSEFRRFIESKDILIKEQEFQQDIDYIKLMIKSEIAQFLWDREHFYQIRILGDEQVQEALKHFEKAAKIAGLTPNKNY